MSKSHNRFRSRVQNIYTQLDNSVQQCGDIDSMNDPSRHLTSVDPTDRHLSSLSQYCNWGYLLFSYIFLIFSLHFCSPILQWSDVCPHLITVESPARYVTSNMPDSDSLELIFIAAHQVIRTCTIMPWPIITQFAQLQLPAPWMHHD